MQPYFFPYIGYWQLINAVDCFVLFDESQYMKGGWVNRNRILKPGGGWQYVHVPVQRHAVSEAIRDVRVVSDTAWRDRIFRQLAHYQKTAGFFSETQRILEAVLWSVENDTIGGVNCEIIQKMCPYIGIETEIIVSSSYPFDYSGVAVAEDWAITHCQQLGADELLNPALGAKLFDAKKFDLLNLGLAFLQSNDVVYDQGVTFEPSLSIIDVLMFNGVDETRRLLSEYQIESLVQHREDDCPRLVGHVGPDNLHCVGD
jgi:hypothetical protein